MRVLRVDELTERLGISRTTIWRMERAGEFPRARKLSPNTVGWIESEVNEWLAERPVAAAGGGGDGNAERRAG